MYEIGPRKGMVRFSIRPKQKAKKVELVGCFCEWKPMAMQRQKDGQFVRLVKIPPGTYEYKFIVDGQWLHDQDHSAWSPNAFGTLNSLAQVDYRTD